VGFDDKLRRRDGKPSETYRTTICKDRINKVAASWYSKLSGNGDHQPTLVELRKVASWFPDFIGSIDGLFLTHSGDNIQEIGYQVVESKHNDNNIALQAFLARLSHKLINLGLRPTYSFPSNVTIIEYMCIWKSDETDDGASTSGDSGLEMPPSP
jgi:hypothetical protein